MKWMLPLAIGVSFHRDKPSCNSIPHLLIHLWTHSRGMDNPMPDQKRKTVQGHSSLLPSCKPMQCSHSSLKDQRTSRITCKTIQVAHKSRANDIRSYSRVPSLHGMPRWKDQVVAFGCKPVETGVATLKSRLANNAHPGSTCFTTFDMFSFFDIHGWSSAFFPECVARVLV